MARFDEDFLLGAATAAHQVEGNNTNSDNWAQEQMKHSSFAEPSGIACDHYNRYAEDIALMAKAGLNAYRFSIEWARIEPEEGVFSEKETQHYRDVIRCCKENGLEPVVTLHHFTSPVWLIRKGGWEADTTPADFARYARYIAEQYGSELHYICTINEANMGIQIAAVARQIFQQMVAAGKVQVGVNLEDLMKGNPLLAKENLSAFGTEKPATFVSPRTAHGDEIVMQAHAAARQAIREAAPHIKVGWTLSLHDVQAVPGGEEKAKEEWDQEFTHYLSVMAEDDFLGVQNYSRTIIGPDGSLPVPEGKEKTQMDYEYYPEGLAHVLRRVAKAEPRPGERMGFGHFLSVIPICLFLMYAGNILGSLVTSLLHSLFGASAANPLLDFAMQDSLLLKIRNFFEKIGDFFENLWDKITAVFQK